MKRWISHVASLFVSTIEIGYIEKTIDIYSRRGAENAKVDEYNDTSLQKNTCHLCALCASARKKDVKAGLSAKQQHAATVRLSQNQYTSFAPFALFAANYCM